MSNFLARVATWLVGLGAPGAAVNEGRIREIVAETIAVAHAAKAAKVEAYVDSWREDALRRWALRASGIDPEARPGPSKEDGRA